MDVSALGNVHILGLRECRGITDVSALGSVHKLDFRGCPGIMDMSEVSLHYMPLDEGDYLF